ncbi:MAG TPA: SIMPL domain-containing protein [Thermodesulfobacteriota bacterium]|nr:SIMPL domain-containing protein [Thermodesulfobacteriota bacterium]
MSKKIVSVGLAMFISLFSISHSVFAQPEKVENTLEATGRGEVKVKPDVAYLTLSVETNAKEASEAVKTNADKMAKVINNLKPQIGKQDKISTSGYQLYPVYEYNEKLRESELTGYRAVNQVIVETKNLNGLGKLIDSATQVGANRIESLSFGTDRREEYRRQALVKAVQDAKGTAETVAKAAGVTIARIHRISPSYDVPMPVYRDFAGAQKLAAESAPTPIEPGELTVSATVSIVFEIE